MDTLHYVGFIIFMIFVLVFIAYVSYGIGRDFKSAYQNHLTEQLEKTQKEIYYLKVELRETEYSREAIKNSHAHLAKLHNEQIDKITRLKNELAENERLKDAEVKNKNRIKELEVSCERRNTAIRILEGRIAGYKSYIINLQKKYSNEKPKFEESNKEKIESLRKIIEPIEQWINENACPHDKLIITQGNVEFTSGEFGIPLDIKD